MSDQYISKLLPLLKVMYSPLSGHGVYMKLWTWTTLQPVYIAYTTIDMELTISSSYSYTIIFSIEILSCKIKIRGLNFLAIRNILHAKLVIRKLHIYVCTAVLITRSTTKFFVIRNPPCPSLWGMIAAQDILCQPRAQRFPPAILAPNLPILEETVPAQLHYGLLYLQLCSCRWPHLKHSSNEILHFE